MVRKVLILVILAAFSFLAAAFPDPNILCNSARSSGVSVTRYFFAIVGLLCECQNLSEVGELGRKPLERPVVHRRAEDAVVVRRQARHGQDLTVPRIQHHRPAEVPAGLARHASEHRGQLAGHQLQRERELQRHGRHLPLARVRLPDRDEKLRAVLQSGVAYGLHVDAERMRVDDVGRGR